MKQRIEEAASLQGRSITDFVTEAALAEASRVIEHERVIALGDEDNARLSALIMNPPKPTAALRRLLHGK